MTTTQQKIAAMSESGRKLDGAEKHEVYRAFKLPALAEKIAAAAIR